MPYTIQEHSHRFAAWAAATAASASPLCRFPVKDGVAILEASGFRPDLASPDQLPEPEAIDAVHYQWREKVIAVAAAQTHEICFTHGIAAKLINCYLKARFVCAGTHSDPRLQALHPPIDALLLKELAKRDVGGQAKEWHKLHLTRWSKFDSATYENAIHLIRASLPDGEPLWKIEEHWGGFR